MVYILVNYLAITEATKAGLQVEVEVDLIQRRIITAEALALLAAKEEAAEEDRTKEASMSDEGLMAYPNQEAGERLAARVITRRQATEAMELCLYGLQFIEIKSLVPRNKSTGKSQYEWLNRERMSEG